MTNNRQLATIMKKHNITRRQLAKLTGQSMHAINKYFASESSQSYRACPDVLLNLLKLAVFTSRHVSPDKIHRAPIDLRGVA